MIVETGSGVVGANSYVSAEEADTYFEPEDNTAWTEQDEIQKDVFLVKASRAIDREFAGRWVGQRSKLSQGLDWPRTNAVDKNGFDVSYSIPTCLRVAVCERAEQLRSGVSTTATTARIKRESVEVGPVKTETEYVDGATASTGSSVSLEDILLPLLRSGPSSRNLTRV